LVPVLVLARSWVLPQVQEVLEVVERVVGQLVEAVEVEVQQQVRELAKWTERSDPKAVLLIEKHVITSHRHMI
jgi:hypothetical protein